MPHARGVRSPYEDRTTVAAFARPVRLRPVDRRSTPCPRTSPIAPRTSWLAVQTQRRKVRRTRPERSAWPEPEPTSSRPWQPREPMLPDDRDFGPAMAPSHPTAAHRAGYSNRGHADAVVVGHRLAARILRAAWPIAEELRKLAWPTEARGCGGRRCPLGQASAAETYGLPYGYP